MRVSKTLLVLPLVIVCLVVNLTVLSNFLFVTDNRPCIGCNDPAFRQEKMSGLSDAPIAIDNDQELEQYASDNQLQGDGSKSSPFVFQNLTFSIGTDRTHGFRLLNINHHVLVTNCSFTVTGLSSMGMVISGSRNIQLHANSFVNNHLDGLWVSESSSVIITENLFEGNAGGAVKVTHSSNVLASHNIFQGNDYGFEIMYSSLTSLDCNLIHSNRVGVAVVDSSDVNISHNAITENERSGIILNQRVKDNIIADNNIARNEIGVQFLVTSPVNKILRNNITQNSVYGVFLHIGQGAVVQENNFDHDNPTQVRVEAFSDVTVSNNTFRSAYQEGEDFIFVIESDNVITKQNNIQYDFSLSLDYFLGKWADILDDYLVRYLVIYLLLLFASSGVLMWGLVQNTEQVRKELSNDYSVLRYTPLGWTRIVGLLITMIVVGTMLLTPLIALFSEVVLHITLTVQIYTFVASLPAILLYLIIAGVTQRKLSKPAYYVRNSCLGIRFYDNDLVIPLSGLILLQKDDNALRIAVRFKTRLFRFIPLKPLYRFQFRTQESYQEFLTKVQSSLLLSAEDHSFRDLWFKLTRISRHQPELLSFDDLLGYIPNQLLEAIETFK